MLIIFCVAMLVMLEDTRRQKRSILALEFQYKLFELRDELRVHVIANPHLTKNWVFEFLDSTITKLISILPRMSVWKVLSLLLIHRGSESMRRLRTHLEREYGKPDNSRFHQIELKLMAIIGKYIGKRHSALVSIINFLVFKLLKGMLVAAHNLRKETLVVAVESPETSTLGEHCPA